MAQERIFIKIRKSQHMAADLISGLPREIIDQIVGYLPLHDAARMSVLSRKWLDVWTSTPQLNVNAEFFNCLLEKRNSLTHEFNSVVSKVLLQHEGPVVKFSLFVPPLIKFYPDIGQCISFLSRNGIRDFSLENLCTHRLKLSWRLFSCRGLESLNLRHCRLDSPTAGVHGFQKLTNLELDKMAFQGHAFEHLIANSPSLRKLSLTNCSEVGDIVIDAPDLSSLTVDGTLFRSLEVRTVNNLVSVCLGLQKLVKVYFKDLADACKLEEVRFIGHFCKALFKEGLIPTTFGKVRTLHLSSTHLDDLDDFCSVITTIQSCPKLEELEIVVEASNNPDWYMLDYNPDIRLNHLRYAEVVFCSLCNMELKLVEFLLACSPVLKKLRVSWTKFIEPELHSKLMWQLNKFRRESPEAEVICPYPSLLPVERKWCRNELIVNK